MREKMPYVGFRVEEWYDEKGMLKQKRTYVGETWAVSEAKARVNVEYRDRGKALYGGSQVTELFGIDKEIYYEVERKW